MQERVCVVGTGYVGMASTIGLATLGHVVTGYDILPERIAALREGITPYREAGIAETLRDHLDATRVSFHDDLELATRGARYVIVTVGTPSHDDGSADLRAVNEALAALAPLAGEAIIVLRSKEPPSKIFSIPTGSSSAHATPRWPRPTPRCCARSIVRSSPRAIATPN